MDKNTVDLVRSSWAQMAPQAGPAASFFYATLFDMDPRVRSLFKGDMAEQGAKLMKMIDVAVARLDQLDVLVPALQQLADRHATYGVRAVDFETVGDALIATLERHLGDSFTPAVRDAWNDVYLTMAEVMIARMSNPGVPQRQEA